MSKKRYFGSHGLWCSKYKCVPDEVSCGDQCMEGEYVCEYLEEDTEVMHDD